MKTIVIGPSEELHAGFHGSLVSDPPPGWRFSRRNGVHVFVLPRPGRGGRHPNPHGVFHHGEFLDFGRGSGLVHSANWPVLRRSSWVVDLDNFGYPVLAGRHAWSPAFRKAFRKPWSPSLAADIGRRFDAMLDAYAHPSCRAVLFWTKSALDDASQWIARLRPGPTGEHLLRKCRVVYPAQRAVQNDAVMSKWSRPGPLRVVFCGRDFPVKNGALALDVFAALVGSPRPVRFTYVGEIPGEEKSRPVLQHIEHYSSVSRSRMLEIFRQAHVLFHPSKSESLGMVFLEAAAAGMAIVAARGPSMRHVDELLDDRGALLVDRWKVDVRSERAFFRETLSALIADRARARRLGVHNHRLVLRGRFSVGARGKTLGGIYDAAQRSPTAQPLVVQDLLRRHGGNETRLSTEMLWRAHASYQRRLGEKAKYIFF